MVKPFVSFGLNKCSWRSVYLLLFCIIIIILRIETERNIYSLSYDENTVVFDTLNNINSLKSFLLQTICFQISPQNANQKPYPCLSQSPYRGNFGRILNSLNVDYFLFEDCLVFVSFLSYLQF